jgi:Lrp/AsnC family leucine-responsive transcriptional regulator
MLDDIDRRILTLLQRDARTANAAIARDVGLAPSAVFQRIRKLEETGIIRGYHAHLDPAALDQGLMAFVAVQTGEGARAKETAEMLAEIPEVLEVHRVVGEDCFLLKVRVRDAAALGSLLDEKVQRLPPVASTRTTIVLSTAKNEIPGLGEGTARSLLNGRSRVSGEHRNGVGSPAPVSAARGGEAGESSAKGTGRPS